MQNIKQYFFTVCLPFVHLFIPFEISAQPIMNLVPMPAEVSAGKGTCIIQQPLRIIVNGSIKTGDGGIQLFKHFLTTKYGISQFDDKASNSNGPGTALIIDIDNENKSNGYQINITNKAISIRGNAPGIFYAFETIKQLLKKGNKKQVIAPYCTIKDYPRFNYRGMHLDVARHFVPVDMVKRYIDYLAMYKFNTFHWHLTEDQGWRIEIKKYPKLTEVGAWRNGTIIGRYPGKGNNGLRYGGYYTQDEIKEVVQYAAERYITIIPEIEMPGHSSAAIAAYPELSCFPDEDTKYPAECAWNGTSKGKQVQQTWGVFEDVYCPSEYTFTFLENVLDEVMQLFPSPYIHIGGDECPKESWKRSDFCQQLMMEKGLKDEHELQSYFIQRMERYINSKGKKIIGWDEILEGGLAPNATVMSWRGEEGGIEAAKQNHDVIMTPGEWCYFDHSQRKNEDSVTIGGYTALEKVYGYEPVPSLLTAEQAKHVLGAQANVWTEYITNQSKLEYMIFPRMAALAEVLWTPKIKRNWKDFERRLPAIFNQLQKDKINYSKAYFDPELIINPTQDYEGLTVELQCKSAVGSIMYADGLDDTVLYYSKANKKITQTSKLKMVCADKKNKMLSNWLYQDLYINKATGKKITVSPPPDSKYPGDGAFTLVNGIQNTTGFLNSWEFTGFSGSNCEAVIDLNKSTSIHKVTVHALHQADDWIWKPAAVEVFTSKDGINFEPAGSTTTFDKTNDANGTMTVKFEKLPARFVKVLIQNWGTIPAGNNGSGSAAWLFVDEIEVE